MCISLRERLADVEHEQWAHWTKYMLDNLTEKNIARWRTQIATPYSELTEKEKDSDREWADRVLAEMHKNEIKTIKTVDLKKMIKGYNLAGKRK